ncbi:phosphatase domain-containing protein [Roseiconus lacunae]|uniref:App1 family protein n=1 Tax=Roseiconus lacunae TaxID=2605694 RepID=UPI003092663C|nr:phosphatase domain-containing protein [Stieleria sp. HD01]
MRGSLNSAWRTEWKPWLTRTTAAADELADKGIRRLRKRLGREGVPKIQPYVGYASSGSVQLHGRVLTNPPTGSDLRHHRWWDNLADTIRRFASDEVPGVEIEATYHDQRLSVLTDAEGYFRAVLPRPAKSGDAFWDVAKLRMTDHPKARRQSDQAVAQVMNVPDEARFGIISDVDDTILHTGATDIATMAKLTFFGNARTRAPLDGVAKLYEHLQSGKDRRPTNPIFYVSSSPWNLHDLLEDFLGLNGIPFGPLLLRDFGIDEAKFIMSGHDHKLEKARRLIKAFDRLPFLLFGDSGQEDARLYASVAREFPDRIAGIFIRDVDPNGDNDHDGKVDRYVCQAAEVGVPMYLVADSTQVATIAIDHGWLSATALDSIVEASKRDKSRSKGILQP